MLFFFLALIAIIIIFLYLLIQGLLGIIKYLYIKAYKKLFTQVANSILHTKLAKAITNAIANTTDISYTLVKLFSKLILKSGLKIINLILNFKQIKLFKLYIINNFDRKPKLYINTPVFYYNNDLNTLTPNLVNPIIPGIHNTDIIVNTLNDILLTNNASLRTSGGLGATGSTRTAVSAY